MMLDRNTPGAAGTASGGGIVSGCPDTTLSFTPPDTTNASRFARAWLIAHYGVRPKVVAVILEASGLGGDA